MPSGGDNQLISFQAAPDVVARLVGDETVIVNLKTEDYFSLNASGAFIWSCLVDGNPVQRAAEQLTSHYSISNEQATTDVNELTDLLLTNGLLVPVG